MTDDPPTDIVLGSELAAARVKDRDRRLAHPGPTFLEDLRYDGPSKHVDAPTFDVDPLDHQLRRIAGSWDRPAAELALLRDRLSLDDLYTLIAFARRTTILGLRTGDAAWPRAGLAALSPITPDRVDHRDLTWAAALVSYTLSRLTATAIEEIRRTAARADPSTGRVLRRFADQPPESLGEWGYAVIGEGRGITLAGRHHRPWHPTIDLTGVAQRIAAVIDAEGSYAATAITIATHLPDVWLNGAPEQRAARLAGERAVACVSVQARPLQADQPGHHMFTVFVPECSDGHAAALIARAAHASTGDHARLAVSQGTLTAVLIARSVVIEVRNLEDGPSLERFERPLAEALRT